MRPRKAIGNDTRLSTLAALFLLLNVGGAAEMTFHVDPITGDDDAPGTQSAPFRTVHRAQAAARSAAKSMDGNVVVRLAPGEYRLDRTLEFTEADSGRNGFHVIYRSDGGPGKARLLGSILLVGWEAHRDGIWKHALSEGVRFHTLYENGRRAQ